MSIDYPTTRGSIPDPLQPLATIKLNGIKIDITECDDLTFDLWITWKHPKYGMSRVPVLVKIDQLHNLGNSLKEVAEKIISKA